MGSISAVGSQIPIPPSVNQDSLLNQNASNPVSDLNTQQNLAEATNAGTAASNAAATGESALKGILANLNLSPTTKA